MLKRKHVRRIVVAAVLAGVPMLQASAQTASPTSPTAPPSASPPVTQPNPTMPTRPMDKSVTAPSKISPLVGLTVFSADGNKMGTVHSVSAGPDGKATAIRIKTGGFLGFGAKLVAIPEGRFTQSGSNIQLALTADEVSKLPEVQGQS